MTKVGSVGKAKGSRGLCIHICTMGQGGSLQVGGHCSVMWVVGLK